MSTFLVPPGGFAGFSQMTPATRAALSQGMRGRASPRRKASRTKVRASGRRRSKRLPKFGSPAWRKKFKLGKRRK